MALQALMHLFPDCLGALGTVVDVGLAGGGLVLAGGAYAAWVRHQRKCAVRLEVARHGLAPEATELLACLLLDHGADAARVLLANGEGLRQRLAYGLSAQHRRAGASRFALGAAKACDGLRLRDPRYPCAPLLFEEVVLRDDVDPSVPPVRGWVTRVEDERLAVITPEECPWPVRRDLQLERPTSDAAPVQVSLLMRPSQASPEWILDHAFDYAGPDRRAVLRREARKRIAAWALPCTAGAYALRARLQQDVPVDTESLRRLRGWPHRKQVVIEDMSSDGCRLAVTCEADVGDRFYLSLSHTDGIIAALPLAEVVSVRPSLEDGLLLGMRFRAVRLRERLLLAEFATSLEDVPAAV